MKKIGNEEGINTIEFSTTIYPRGKRFSDSYKAEIDVYFEPRAFYMDYCELTDKLAEISGIQLTIEEVANAVFRMLLFYDPSALVVKVRAESNKHIPVTITKRK